MSTLADLLVGNTFRFTSTGVTKRVTKIDADGAVWARSLPEPVDPAGAQPTADACVPEKYTVLSTSVVSIGTAPVPGHETGIPVGG